MFYMIIALFVALSVFMTLWLLQLIQCYRLREDPLATKSLINRHIKNADKLAIVALIIFVAMNILGYFL